MDDNLRKKVFKTIEKKFEIKIIFACEWGSRAYGLNSNVSDFDVRFVYINRPVKYYDVYLDIKGNNDRNNLKLMDVEKIQRETITGLKKKLKIDGVVYDLDWQGWDITKAIKHLYEMNPSIIEFVYSPVIYKNNPNYQFLQTAKAFIEGQKRITPILKVPIRCCIMFLWIWKAKDNSDEFIQLNVDTILKDIDEFLPDKLINQIKKMFDKKRDIKSSDDQTSRNKIIDKMIRDILFKDGLNEINEKEKKEYDVSKYIHIQKYNKYLYSCLYQQFKK